MFMWEMKSSAKKFASFFHFIFNQGMNQKEIMDIMDKGIELNGSESATKFKISLYFEADDM